MVDKYIALLQKQIDRLDEDDFDLEAWKSGAIVLLSRVFGDASSKIVQIEKIKFDFGSWSLRDSSGSRDQMESCKKRCRGILEASITELEVLGSEEEAQVALTKKGAEALVIDALEQELKISQLKQLVKILRTKSSRDEKERMLFTVLMGFDPEIASKIVARIMTDPALGKSLK